MCRCGSVWEVGENEENDITCEMFGTTIATSQPPQSQKLHISRVFFRLVIARFFLITTVFVCVLRCLMINSELFIHETVMRWIISRFAKQIIMLLNIRTLPNPPDFIWALEKLLFKLNCCCLFFSQNFLLVMDFNLWITSWLVFHSNLSGDERNM